MDVGVFETKNRLSELLAIAARGERVYVTRRGRRVAVLSGVADAAADASNELESADLLRRFRQLRRAARGEETAGA